MTTQRIEENQLLKIETSSEQAGFRLDRLEVVNWGTFDRDVVVMRLDGKTALLTGPNGSGKSTLVDALLTLLVPKNLGRNYNMASGAKKKTERTERTYIQGVWAEGLVSADSSVVEPKKLRPISGTPSILLAVFHNAVTSEWCSIAQIHWVVGDDEDYRLIVSFDDRTIVKDFGSLGDPRKMGKILENRGMRVFDTWSGYAETFCKRMHLRYPDALSLFNTVVAIKETGEIAEFIRRHMLVKYDKGESLIAEADQHLEDLETCKRDIETAKKQIELLRPIDERAKKLNDARETLSEVQSARDALLPFFAHVFSKLAAVRLKELDGLYAETEVRFKDTEKLKADAKERLAEANKALGGSPVLQQVEAIRKQVSDADASLSGKKTARVSYECKLQELGLKESVTSEGQFRAMHDRLTSKLNSTKGAFEDAIKKISEYEGKAKALRTEAEAKRRELSGLEYAKSRIRGELATLRELVCRGTGIPLSSLPFAGELIEVKPNSAAWRPTLEMLLGGFGRSMLIDEANFREVMKFLHHNRINGRLDFNRISIVPASLAEHKAGDSTRVISLLNLRPDHPMRGSVAEEIRRRYPHVCCQDESDFTKHEFAITQGLLQRSGSRGTKDDRRKTIDPESYVLGWNNEDLVRHLLQKVKDLDLEAAKFEGLAGKLEQSKSQSDTNRETLSELLRCTFDQINTGPELLALGKAQDALNLLLKGDPTLGKLTAARDKADGEQTEAEKALQGIAAEQITLELERRNIDVILEKRKEMLGQITEEKIESLGPKIRSYSKRAISLSAAPEIESDAIQAVDQDAKRKHGACDQAASALRDSMNTFLYEFPNLKSDLTAHEDKVGDFLQLMQVLDKEKLPDAEARFVRLMNSSIQKNISLLDQKLRKSVEEYKIVLRGLNASLREIDYNRGTFIRIAALPSRSAIILQFQRDLKECLIGATDPTKETMEKAFGSIRGLLGKLKSDEDWRRRVIDTRNWLDFRADEVTFAQPEEITPHSSSDSKSGGQKAKLAFTVMAASLAHQFGLLRENAPARSFRFVVIDEIFGKTDEANSIYALNLFKKFQLQLLVVCPFSAQARVVDEFVSSYHLTANPAWNNSKLISATLEQINAARAETTAVES